MKDDPSSLDAIYRRYAPMMFRRCVMLLGNEEEAKDALHDLFVSLERKLTRFEKRSQLSTWLYRITTNHCLNRIRDERNRGRIRETMTTDDRHDPRPRLERRNLLFRLLSELEEREVAMAIYRHLDGMTQPEIAEVMEVSERTVRTHLRRLEGRLAEELERHA